MSDGGAIKISPAHAVGGVIDIGPALTIGDEVALFVVGFSGCRSAIGDDAGILVEAIDGVGLLRRVAGIGHPEEATVRKLFRGQLPDRVSTISTKMELPLYQ